jgi:hypothetical protein
MMMKIDAPLFSRPVTLSASPTVSEARRAFEAMLSAGAQRQTVGKPDQTMSNTPAVRGDASQSNDAEVMARPGRIVDLKV